ncbi:MAG: hypothetical protein CMM94_08765 [Rickettsiales bacterium]|nr:hypothetical protein [Rickettsiales bacterium]|tara:strand:- start:616 stop:1131 length:516 start_codon:yes stop_codon:yes gene_type:complete
MKRIFLVLACCALTACGVVETDAEQSYPQRDELDRRDNRGKLTGEAGLSLGGGNDAAKDAGANPLGVNAFLWRATLDTLAFMPFTNADPFGGVIITDWYEDPNARGERFKITAMILDRQLRADGVKISLFKQRLDQTGAWRDVEVDKSLERKLEDTILTRARQLRVKQAGE